METVEEFLQKHVPAEAMTHFHYIEQPGFGYLQWESNCGCGDDICHLVLSASRLYALLLDVRAFDEHFCDYFWEPVAKQVRVYVYG